MNRSVLAAAMIGGLMLGGCDNSAGGPDVGDAASAGRPDAGAAASTGGKSSHMTVADHVAASPLHKMLASNLAASGLADRLDGSASFTLFAPTDAAFVQVPPVMRDNWMRPAQKARLAAVVGHHIVAGRHSGAQLQARIDAEGGPIVLKSIDGQDIVISRSGSSLLLTAGSGNKAMVIQADVAQSNGMIHVVDAVLLPAG
ncbi:MAG: fasciclin domain-containing protein [Sphingopyxis sp.]|uniref:fasciclin domain-containing protein n=1 Tax=Sphingopyxis sp. TaxID=1908224 RepID=UPI002ABC7CE1|nr:fasciclin domain-containing protein [Sphingopyxis sp.]MDZ3831087.1 fasciclin domain-containing protein [Sphingopyxis sp.]